MMHLILSFLLISIVACQMVEIADNEHCPGQSPCVVRTFYIQAEEVDWDYAPSGMDHITEKPIRDSDAHTWNMRYKYRIGSIYRKAQYFGYTDALFLDRIPQPAHLGIMGPVIRAEG